MKHSIHASLWTTAIAVLLAASTAGRASSAQSDANPARPSHGWHKKTVLPASEAHQAAAATKDFVFAISSRLIAKYDRATGKRLAESRGKARHLNSGFIWEGKLYCAHSNYPQIPEHSEIKVLDLESMELATFKDFGASEGSLTWVVRHDNRWWCTFAYYGQDNPRTYLARFDDHWLEERRWLYPPEVIARMGTASISGGLWRGDSILATGHDAREIHHLRIPDDGNVLEFVETLPSPFPGQGIADDPATGGLVGIDRQQRQVVFAELQPPAAP